MKTLSIAFIALFSLGSLALAEVPILPFDEVRAGMSGIGRTVFSGTEVVSFEVEILGKLSDVGPEHNLIFARCSGGPLEQTGILSGMSGSPVTIDGKLIGAIAYSFPFTTEPIAGITPIEEMLRIANLDGAEPGTSAGMQEFRRDALAALLGELPAEAVVERLHWPALRARGAALPLTVPLAVSGLSASLLEQRIPQLRAAGLQPLQAGSAGGAGAPAPPLEPGSAIGLKLIRGDLEVTATGTATWVDGERVLGFGHPLLGLGAIDLPLTAARAELLLPSVAQSARLAAPLEEIGALRQDRAAGVFGLLGVEPRMIPVRLQLIGTAGGRKEYSYDIAEDSLLSPLLLYVSLNGILAARERPAGEMTLRLREGSGIKLVGRDDVALDNLFAGPTALQYGTGLAAYVLHVLMNNAWTPARVAGINLILEYQETPRSARVRRLTLDRYHVSPGESLEARILLAPFRGREVTLTRRIEIPEQLPPGRLTLHVGSALDVQRDERELEPVLPRSLDELIRLINQLRRNDQVHIVATRADSGVLLGGTRLPNLPPSVARQLSRPGSRGDVRLVPQRKVLEEQISTSFAVEGLARVEIDVEER